MAAPGVAGSVVRFPAAARWPVDAAAGAVPWGTPGVDVLGAFILGALVGAVPAGHPARLLVGMGLGGGFTTLSTFAVGGLALVEGGAPGRGAWGGRPGCPPPLT